MMRMINAAAIGILFFTATFAYAQKSAFVRNDSLYSTYYQQRASLFRLMPAQKKPVIFLGDSITDGCEWSEIFHDNKILNRGISGDVTDGVLNRLAEIERHQPSKVFILIGINDLARGIGAERITNNILAIVEGIHSASPKTKVYVQSIFPVNSTFDAFKNHYKYSAAIPLINKTLFDAQKKGSYQYLDIATHLMDGAGRLDAKYTNDGLHLTGRGYKIWTDVLKPYLKSKL